MKSVAGQHTMVVTIPVGPSDMGAEQECSITFKFRPGGVFRMYRRNGDPADPPDPPEVQFVKAEPYLFGKPSPFGGACADLEMSALQQTASDWLETDAGFEAAHDHVDNLPCKVLFYFKHHLPKKVVILIAIIELIVAAFIIPVWATVILVVAMVAVIVAVLVLAEMGGVDDRGPLG